VENPGCRQSGSSHSLSSCAFFGGKERPDVWVQCYDPLGNWPASTLAAAVPVFVLLGLLAWGRLNAAGAALAGLSAACIMQQFPAWGFSLEKSPVFVFHVVIPFDTMLP